MDSTEDVILLVRWYAKYGRTPDLRLRAAQIELAVQMLDHLDPGWRYRAVPVSPFSDADLSPLGASHVSALLAHIFPHH